MARKTAKPAKRKGAPPKKAKRAAPVKKKAARKKTAGKSPVRKAVKPGAAKKKAAGKIAKKAPKKPKVNKQKTAKKSQPAKKSPAKKPSVKTTSVEKKSRKPAPKAAARPAATPVKAPMTEKARAREAAAEAKRAVAAAKKAAAAAAAAKEAEITEVYRPSPTLRFPDVGQPTGSYNGIVLTEDVKPFPKKSAYTRKELSTLRQALTGERDQLLRELASLDNTSREVMDLSKEHPGYSLHLAEHATDLQTAEASLGVRSIVRERLEQVGMALNRLEERPAQYGLCLACGNKIGAQRLQARPHAHLCMDCRQRYERIRSRRGY